MAELEWGLTERGQMAASDFDINTLSDIVWAIKKLTVNGVPLADMLAEIADGLDGDPHGVGVDLRDYQGSIAVLRALADRGET